MGRAILALCALSALSAATGQGQQHNYQYQYPPTQYPIYRPHSHQARQVQQVQLAPAASQQQQQVQVVPYGLPPQQYQQYDQRQAQPSAMQEQRPAGPLPYEEWTRAVDEIIAKGVTQLSLSLAEAVERDGDIANQVGNVVFSPVNVAAALALVLAGSNGTTFSEIANVLGIHAGVNVLENRELVHKEFGRFLGQLEGSSTIVNAGDATGGNHVVFANGLFVQQEYNIQPYFAEIAKAYKSQVIPVDFAREPSRTKDRVNSWFSEHTMGRIRSVLSEAPPTDSKLMIASALFFNGAWEAPFPIEATMTRPFFGVSANGSREASAVRMMTNNMDLPLAVDKTLGCRLLELPYRGRDVSMYLILPDADGLTALRELEARLRATPDTLERLIEARKDAPVIYSVPRMKLQRSISLRTALETLGVRSLFDENLADLSHLSESVVQRAPLPAPTAAPAPAPAASAPATTPRAPASAGAATPAPAAPAAPGASVGQPSPNPNRGRPTRRPQSHGENTIGPDSQFYFSSRISSLAGADKANDTVQTTPQTAPQPELGDRWNAPQQLHPARLYADDVLHKVEVEVTETGTVASAATAITISRDGSNHVMRFNRPFIFFIRHNLTKLILFYGTVVRPMPEWIVPGVDVSHLPPPRPSTGHRQPPPPLGLGAAGAPGSARRPPLRQRVPATTTASPRTANG